MESDESQHVLNSLKNSTVGVPEKVLVYYFINEYVGLNVFTFTMGSRYTGRRRVTVRVTEA